MGTQYLEADMAKFIERWLFNRNKNPCSHVYSELPYSFGGRKRRADFVGIYESGGHSYFVGVEAKRTKERLDEVVRQGIRLQSFCHEVYIALPKSSYAKFEQDERDEIRSLLKTAKVGLLLVKKRGLPEIERPVDVDMFRLDLYHNALEFFSEDDSFEMSEEEGERLLDQFLNASGMDGYGYGKSRQYSYKYPFREDDWIFVSTDEGGEFETASGTISVKGNNVEFTIRKEEPIENLKSQLLGNSAHVVKEINKQLIRLSGQVKWDLRGLSDAPKMTIFLSESYSFGKQKIVQGPWKAKEHSIEIDLPLLTDKNIVFGLGTLLKDIEDCEIEISASLSRKILEENGVSQYRHQGWFQDPRDMYDILYQIGALFDDEGDE